MVSTPSAVSIKNVVPIAVTVLIVVLEKRILKMFTEHYVKKLRLETNTKKLTSNSFSTRRPLGPKRGSGAGIACRVNAKRNPDILKCSQLARIEFVDGFNWPAMAILVLYSSSNCSYNVVSQNENQSTHL